MKRKKCALCNLPFEFIGYFNDIVKKVGVNELQARIVEVEHDTESHVENVWFSMPQVNKVYYHYLPTPHGINKYYEKPFSAFVRRLLQCFSVPFTLNCYITIHYILIRFNDDILFAAEVNRNNIVFYCNDTQLCVFDKIPGHSSIDENNIELLRQIAYKIAEIFVILYAHTLIGGDL